MTLNVNTFINKIMIKIIYKYNKGDFMIKEKRISLHLTQEQMAEKLNISLRQYIRIDNEQSFPRRDVLKKLIAELKLTNEEIGKYIRNITKDSI